MRPYSIYLDPGHGGKDPGAISPDGKYREKDIVLNIGRLFKRAVLTGDYLYYAYLTRFSDRYLTPDARCKMANERGVDLFISLHCNSAADPRAEGVEVWYCEGSERSKDLAAELYRSLLVTMPGINGRGIKASNESPHGSLYVLEHTIMPAVLIEFEFLSNPQEFIIDADDQRGVVRGLAETVEEFFEGGRHEI